MRRSPASREAANHAGASGTQATSDRQPVAQIRGETSGSDAAGNCRRRLRRFPIYLFGNRAEWPSAKRNPIYEKPRKSARFPRTSPRARARRNNSLQAAGISRFLFNAAITKDESRVLVVCTFAD